VAYFYEKCFHIYRGFTDAPGYRSEKAIASGLASQGFARENSGLQTPLTWKDRVAQGAVVTGSPSQVTEQLREVSKDLGVGHLMCLLQLGNLGREATMRNVKLFGEQVLPHLRDVHSEWEDKWWIQPLASQTRPEIALSSN
jgi:alkanesulfonate monooxygenase SsuD/methylene tetrahydromethanopterin reductase-like flavin-dependent oxidoreductase (luciferase family)